MTDEPSTLHKPTVFDAANDIFYSREVEGLADEARLRALTGEAPIEAAVHEIVQESAAAPRGIRGWISNFVEKRAARRAERTLPPAHTYAAGELPDLGPWPAEVQQPGSRVLMGDAALEAIQRSDPELAAAFGKAKTNPLPLLPQGAVPTGVKVAVTETAQVPLRQRLARRFEQARVRYEGLGQVPPVTPVDGYHAFQRPQPAAIARHVPAEAGRPYGYTPHPALSLKPTAPAAAVGSVGAAQEITRPKLFQRAMDWITERTAPKTLEQRFPKISALANAPVDHHIQLRAVAEGRLAADPHLPFIEIASRADYLPHEGAFLDGTRLHLSDIGHPVLTGDTRLIDAEQIIARGSPAVRPIPLPIRAAPMLAELEAAGQRSLPLATKAATPATEMAGRALVPVGELVHHDVLGGALRRAAIPVASEAAATASKLSGLRGLLSRAKAKLYYWATPDFTRETAKSGGLNEWFSKKFSRASKSVQAVQSSATHGSGSPMVGAAVVAAAAVGGYFLLRGDEPRQRDGFADRLRARQQQAMIDAEQGKF